MQIVNIQDFTGVYSLPPNDDKILQIVESTQNEVINKLLNGEYVKTFNEASNVQDLPEKLQTLITGETYTNTEKANCLNQRALSEFFEGLKTCIINLSYAKRFELDYSNTKSGNVKRNGFNGSKMDSKDTYSTMIHFYNQGVKVYQKLREYVYFLRLVSIPCIVQGSIIQVDDKSGFFVSESVNVDGEIFIIQSVSETHNQFTIDGTPSTQGTTEITTEPFKDCRTQKIKAAY